MGLLTELTFYEQLGQILSRGFLKWAGRVPKVAWVTDPEQKIASVYYVKFLQF